MIHFKSVMFCMLVQKNKLTLTKYLMKNLLKHTLFLTTIIPLIWSCETREEVIPPTACFTISEDHIFVGETINFTDCSEDAQSYLWDFGDDNNSIMQNPGHKYNESGEFVVVLRVTNKALQSEVNKTIYVSEIGNDDLLISTSSVTNITVNSATSGGTVTYEGSISAKGVCWSTASNPTISDSHTNDGTTTGTFTSEITDLTPSTKYYVRAYATSDQVYYGEEQTFTTLDEEIPNILVEVKPEDFGVNEEIAIYFNAKLGDGGLSGYTGDVYAHTGLVTNYEEWAYTIADWSINLDKVKLERISNDYYKLLISPSIIEFYNCPSDLIIFKIAIVFRSSDGNLSGRMADASDIFIDIPNAGPVLPTVKTYEPISIGTNSVSIGGEIITNGISTITSLGVCWSTNPNPTIDNEITNDGQGTISFTSEVTGLASGTTYYLRAYGVNDAGVGYGNEISFTTLPSNAQVLLDENFQSYTDHYIIDQNSWMQYIESGTKNWVAREFDINMRAQFGSYGTGEENIVTLITPAINLDNTSNNVLTFDFKIGYWKQNGLKIFVLENLVGEDFANATWVDITSEFDFPTEPIEGYGELLHAKKYNLTNYSGTIHFAFKYSGNDNTGETTTYQIDNVLVYGE